jgi:hypothetical protein
MASPRCDFSLRSNCNATILPRTLLRGKAGHFFVAIHRAERASSVPHVGPIPGTAPNWGHSSEREKLHAKGCRFGSVGQDGTASGDALPKTGDPAPILLLRNRRGRLAASTNRRRPLGVGDEDSDPSGGGVTRNEGRWVVGPRGSRVAPRSSLRPAGPSGRGREAQRPAPADGSRSRCSGWNIVPGAPASHRPRCVILKTGAAAAVAVGTLFPVFRYRTARGVLF